MKPVICIQKTAIIMNFEKINVKYRWCQNNFDQINKNRYWDTNKTRIFDDKEVSIQFIRVGNRFTVNGLWPEINQTGSDQNKPDVTKSDLKIRTFGHFEIYQDKHQQSLSLVDPKLSTNQTSKLIEIKLSEMYQLFKFISEHPTHIALQRAAMIPYSHRFPGNQIKIHFLLSHGRLHRRVKILEKTFLI